MIVWKVFVYCYSHSCRWCSYENYMTLFFLNSIGSILCPFPWILISLRCNTRFSIGRKNSFTNSTMRLKIKLIFMWPLLNIQETENIINEWKLSKLNDFYTFKYLLNAKTISIWWRLSRLVITNTFFAAIRPDSSNLWNKYTKIKLFGMNRYQENDFINFF